MPVYVLREGNTNNFKIGRTSGTVEGVIKRLRTGNPRPLNQFAIVETDQESACEAFFHRHLRERRVVWGGGWEFFEFDPTEMESIIGEVQRMFEERSEIRLVVEQLKLEATTDDLIEPTDEDRQILNRLLLIEKEQELLSLESEMLKGKLMRRIGKTSGIRGIATWKTQLTRVYNEDLFRDSDPERYQGILEKYYCLDTAAWKSDKPEEYKEIQTTYFSPRVSRSFRPQKVS